MWSKGINRNIVECKAMIVYGILWDIDVLIETLWNVKTVFDVDEVVQQLVLIETLWNVKVFIAFFYSGSLEVLIETLWNVKRVQVRTSQHKRVLIETLWNVK